MTRTHKLRINPHATIVEFRSCGKGKRRTKVLIKQPISSWLDFDGMVVDGLGTIDNVSNTQWEVIG